MGAGCAKSHQVKQTKTKELAMGTHSHSNNNKIIIILNELLERSSWGHFEERENCRQYRFEFNEISSTKFCYLDYQKFTSRVGFEHCSKLTPIQKGQFIFKSYKTDTQEVVVEIEQPEDAQETLWKKVNIFGSPIHLNEQIKLGGNIMKLVYFLNQDEIRAMQEGSEEIQIKQFNPLNHVCRLCLNEEKESPFILPCKCDESKIVHQKCLSMEVFDQTVTLDDFKTAFRFVVKKTKCQFCSESLEKYIWKRFLANLKLHDGYYAIFERKVSSEINTLEHIEFLVVRFRCENEGIKIGRSKICHYSIPEDDIDKIHATMAVKDKLLYIFDDGSKTGTYIEQKGNQIKFGDELFIDRFNLHIKKEPKFEISSPKLKKSQTEARLNKIRW